MPDFETHPIGTADRLKALEAENARLREALRSIAEPRLGGGEWAASVARTCLAEHLQENATIDDLELPLRLKRHLGCDSPAILILDILADKKHPLWGNISHRDERIIREIAPILLPQEYAANYKAWKSGLFVSAGEKQTERQRAERIEAGEHLRDVYAALANKGENQ